MATVTNGTSTVPVEIVAARLRRPLRRESIGLLNVAAPQIQAGTPALLAGQITYLAATLADALALDALYAGLAPVTLNAGAIETRRNACTVPRAATSWGVFAGTGGTVTSSVPADARWKGGVARRAVWTVAGTGIGYVSTSGSATMAVGETWLISMRVAVVGYTGALGLSIGGGNSPTVAYGALNTIDHGDGTLTLWRIVTCTSLGAGTGAFIFYASLTNGQVGHELWAGDAIAEKGVTSFAGYLDGGYSPDPALSPAWVGAANASPSILTRADLEAGLAGFKHSAVGTTEMVAEKPPPGRSARWLYSVDVVEVP